MDWHGAKKWRPVFKTDTSGLKPGFHLEKTQNLASEMSLKTASLGGILTQNLVWDIVEAILAGIEPDGLSIAKLTEQPIPEDWNEQRRLYGFPTR